MTRATRIERIIAIKRLDELLATRQLVSARRKLTEGQQLQGELINYCDHYNHRSQQLTQRVDAGSIQRERKFSEQLGKAVEQQQSVVESQRQKVSETNQRWLLRRTQSLATETLLKNVQKADALQTEKISAKEADELAQRIAQRKSR